MFDNVAIDVAIGLVFIFLLYSLLATIIMEFIARWFGMRQRFLVRTVARMLDAQEETNGLKIVDWFTDIADTLKFIVVGQLRNKRSFAKAFYRYPLIRYLAVSKANSKPSYISPDTFSQTLIALLKPDALNTIANPMQQIHDTLFGASPGDFDIDSETRSYLKKLWVDAKGDLEKFKALLENWFIETNERSEGGYKRLTQTVLFVIGLSFAIAFNVDTIAISSILIKNNDVRKRMVVIAQRNMPVYGQLIQKDSSGRAVSVVVPVADTALASQYRQLTADAATVQQTLGLGWINRKSIDTTRIMGAIDQFASSQNAHSADTGLDKAARFARSVTALKRLQVEMAANSNQKSNYHLPQEYGLPLVIVGWLITAFALCLGAPFWFDLLNKIMTLRSATKTQDTDPKPASKTDSNTIPANQRTA